MREWVSLVRHPMIFMPSLTFFKTFSSPDKANAIYSSLSLETGHSFEKRSKTTLSLKNNRIGVSIIADDAHALGVSKNSYSTLIEYLDALENEGAVTHGKKRTRTNH